MVSSDSIAREETETHQRSKCRGASDGNQRRGTGISRGDSPRVRRHVLCQKRHNVLCFALTFFLAILASTASAQNRTYWLETELFRDPGGWTDDSQFVDQMGSPFLLAIGLKGPVADATTEADVTAAGRYRLWVRARDWDVEHSPGAFEILLNGKPTKVFGQSKQKGWVWEDGGTFDLPAGKLEVRLHDRTGHYGRCDAVVLTDDPSYRPPDDLKQLAAQRIDRGGVSRDVKEMGPFDTVVVGGGLAGTFAAVSAARMGCRVALVQDRPVLGGNGSTEVLVRPEGDTTREPLDPGEGGIIEEVRGDVEGYSDRMLKLCRSQPNLTLFLNTHATGVEMKAKDQLAAVLAIDVKTRQRMRFSGTIFIDCTGDGSIGVWAGAEHRHGREPRSMYNESRAPLVGDGQTMGGTLRYATARRAGPVEFKAPDWARHFDRCGDFGRERHPQLEMGGWQWIIEYGGVRNTYDDAEEIRDELLRIIYGMWDHAKNHCPKLAEQAKNYDLTWVSYVVGKRESRRLIGDYVLTEHDVAARTLFPDRVSYCGWGVDLHPPAGFYDRGPPAEFSHKVKFSVPLRCLYSKDVQNLFMAGRCISVSHVALGATRVMITCGLQGQAVGTAAGICKRRGATPRGIVQSYIGELQQQLLKDGCYLIDLPNDDLRDLARTAKATASSTAPPENLGQQRLTVHPLGCSRAVMFQVPGPRIEKISLYLRNDNARPTAVKLGLRSAPTLGDFHNEQNLAEATATAPPKSEGWVEFALNKDVKPGWYYVWLPATPGLGWSLFETAPADTARAYRTGESWQRMSDCYAFRLNGAGDAAPPIAAPRPQQGMFAPENVVNGYARAIRGWPNSWRPDPNKPLPQWIELDFGRAIEFNTVHVSFQTKANRAVDFRLEVFDGQWRPVATIENNADRRRVISLPRTKAFKLRLVVLKATADAGVCEIRVYDESQEAARK